MKKHTYTCEELSEIYDRICQDDELASQFPDMCEKSKEERQQLLGTMSILKGMSCVGIEDIDSFCAKTMESCLCANRVIPMSSARSRFRRFAVPGTIAAGVAVAVLSFTLATRQAPTPNNEIEIASGVAETPDPYTIQDSYVSDPGDVISLVVEQGGSVIKQENDVITVRARLSDYTSIKKELTLSAEEKIFYNRNKNIITAGTASNVYTSHYVDEVITFDIVLPQSSK